MDSLRQRADAGDGDAAWELYFYCSAILHSDHAQQWLIRATDLRNPEAQRLTADRLRMGAPFSRYGVSAQAAVEQLLTDACQRSGSACDDLADAYESGYFGPADLVLARGYYERGAEQGNRSSWQALARLMSEGLGGPVDEARAYFWLSLEARCVDPRSISGRETWKLREHLAASLRLDALEREWEAVDAFMADYHAGKREIYSDPFLGTAIRDDLREEGKREADKRERRHRESLRRARVPAGAE